MVLPKRRWYYASTLDPWLCNRCLFSVRTQSTLPMPTQCFFLASASSSPLPFHAAHHHSYQSDTLSNLHQLLVYHIMCTVFRLGSLNGHVLAMSRRALFAARLTVRLYRAKLVAPCDGLSLSWSTLMLGTQSQFVLSYKSAGLPGIQYIKL